MPRLTPRTMSSFTRSLDDPPTGMIEGELVDPGDEVLLVVDTRQDVFVPVWT